MKLDNRNVKIDKQISSKALTKASLNNVLKLGKQFSATIVSVDGENVSLDYNGRLIQARNSSGEKLFSGMMAGFEVLKSGSERIEIKPIALSGLSSAESDFNFVKSNLTKMGIPLTDDNLGTLAQMMKQGMQISKGNFDDVKFDFLAAQKLADAIFGSADKPDESSNASEVKQGSQNTGDLNELKSDINNKISDDKSLISENQVKDAIKNSLPSNISDKDLLGSLSKSLKNLFQDKGGIVKLKEVIALFDREVQLDKGIQKESAKSELSGTKNFLDAFKNVASDKESLINNIIFLKKAGVSPSIFNLNMTSNMFKGKMGFTSALLDFFDNPSFSSDSEFLEIKSKISNLMKSGINLSEIEGDLDSEKIKEAGKNFKALNNILSELGDKADSVKDGGLKLLSENANLIKSMEPLWQNMMIPFTGGRELSDLEMYVKKDESKSGKKRASDEKVIYLSLKTDSIDRVKVRIDYNKKDLKIVFVMANEEIKNFAETQISKLEGKLSRITDKNVVIALNSDDFDVSLVDFEMMASYSSISNIDMKV